MDPTELPSDVARLWGAYAYLHDHALAHVSGTARLLQAGDPATLAARLADELGELAGVLLGTHVHHGRSADLILEGSQVCYWTYLLALRQGIAFDALAPAAHLFAGATAPVRAPEALAAGARALAGALAPSRAAGVPLGLLQAALAAVGAACAVGRFPVEDVVCYDLTQMAGRPYLRAYFAVVLPPEAGLLDAAGWERPEL